jgi:hypothetical protein
MPHQLAVPFAVLRVRDLAGQPFHDQRSNRIMVKWNTASPEVSC